MFDVGDRIDVIPTQFFDEGYRHISFYLTSLFTKVPLKETINIILHRIYKEKLVKKYWLKTHAQKLLFI